MRTPLSLLLVSSALVQQAATSGDPLAVTADESCRARAWVRAPNLQPGKFLQGDVKVKLYGSCDEVSSYSLGLRFAERAWVKTPREGATLPVKPGGGCSAGRSNSNRSIYEDVEDSHWWLFRFNGNQSDLDQYESELKNPALWLVREEERIAFEIKYDIFNGGTQRQWRDIVKNFAILVPFTNYPPASDWTFGSNSNADINSAGAEHIYRYFVDVAFSNGTHRQIEAGYTSFDATTAIELDHRPVTVNVTAIPSGLKRAAEEDSSRDNFTLEVTFPNGNLFEQGSINDITIVSHQLGPGSQRPLEIDGIYSHTRQQHNWAAKHARDTRSAEELSRYRTTSMRELQPKPNNSYDDLSQHLRSGNLRFSQDVAVTNGKMFSTEPITAQFVVEANIFPPFTMYYETSEVELSIGMMVRNISEPSRPEFGLVEEEDPEYDWTPTLREETSWSNWEYFRAVIPITIYRKDESHTALTSSPVNYLSPEARAPVFVDPSSLPLLLKMTMEERENIAPRCQPTIITKEDEDVVKDRYHTRGSRPPQAHYYVGNTWIRKATSRGDGKAAQENVLVIQA